MMQTAACRSCRMLNPPVLAPSSASARGRQLKFSVLGEGEKSQRIIESDGVVNMVPCAFRFVLHSAAPETLLARTVRLANTKAFSLAGHVCPCSQFYQQSKMHSIFQAVLPWKSLCRGPRRKGRRFPRTPVQPSSFQLRNSWILQYKKNSKMT